jgi:hypothetical protein
MPRALTISRTTVAADQRPAFLERTKARRAHYAAADVRYWVFEEEGLPGSFVEFTEANDLAALEQAHAANPDAPAGINRRYVEVPA